MSDTEKKTVQLTIDGRTFTAEAGKTILEVANENGIKIPTLCYHAALETFGACRLCVVEITKPEWDGWKKLVTSCLFPVEDRLIVSTDSEEVLENRKVVLGLQLARVPNSPEIIQMAAELGIEKSPYSIQENADNCIMCTMCVRACEEIGAFAITTLSRGPEKYVGIPAPKDCIGCGSCVSVCPTSAITMEEENGIRRILFSGKMASENKMLQCEHCGEFFTTEKAVKFFDSKADKKHTVSTKPLLCPSCSRKYYAEKMNTPMAY